MKNLTLPKNSKGNGKGINDHLGALAYSKLISGQEVNNSIKGKVSKNQL